MLHHASARCAAGIPDRAGVGLKPEHYREILEQNPDVGYFEVHAENYMGAGGPPHAYLEAIRERYPLSLHGVGLSIGAAGPLDRAHLSRLKALNERYEPGLFSEHLAWSTHESEFFNDLLPVPYTQETLDIVCRHIDEVQTTLRRQMLLENPSVYVLLEESEIPETEFLALIAARTAAGFCSTSITSRYRRTTRDMTPRNTSTAFRSNMSVRFISPETQSRKARVSGS